MLCFFIIGNKEDYSTKQKLCKFLLQDFKVLNKGEGITSDFSFPSIEGFKLRNIYLHKFIIDCMNNVTGSYLQKLNKALELMSVYHNSIPESTYRGIFTNNRQDSYTDSRGRLFEEEKKKDDDFIKDIEYMSSEDCLEKDYINLDVVRRLFKTYFSLKKLNASFNVETWNQWGESYTRTKNIKVDLAIVGDVKSVLKNTIKTLKKLKPNFSKSNKSNISKWWDQIQKQPNQCMWLEVRWDHIRCIKSGMI